MLPRIVQLILVATSVLLTKSVRRDAIGKHLATNVSESSLILKRASGGQPLDEENCKEAALRVAGKDPGPFYDISLRGYLMDIGQERVGNELLKKVKKMIKEGCVVPVYIPTVKSDSSRLTRAQCLNLKDQTEGKTGMLLENIIRDFLKLLKPIPKTPSVANVELATKQISEGCPEPEEQPLNKWQCLTVKATLAKTNGSFWEVTNALSSSIRMLKREPTMQLMSDVTRQISNSCMGVREEPDPRALEITPPAATKSLQDQVEASPGQQKSKKPKASKERLLTQEECEAAKKAISGAPSMFAGIHLNQHLKGIGKDGSMKFANKVMKELEKDCAQNLDSDIEVVTQESTQEDVQDADNSACVSSGTIRRADFVDDPRFVKYKSMVTSRQPEGAVRGQVTQDKTELLNRDLSEEEIACFLDLLFEKVKECDVAPPAEAALILTPEFLNDPRLKKYMTMKKIRQPRGAVEGRMTLDKNDLLAKGLTEAHIACFLKLAFDDDTECDATPLGEVLGPEFVENDDFTKYVKMHSMHMPRGAIEGRITLDMEILKTKGYDDTKMQCFLKLLYKEKDKCSTGPAGRAKMQSKEAKGLAAAKAAQEVFTSLTDGNDGLMPTDIMLPDISFFTDVFEADLTAVKKAKKGSKKKPKPTAEQWISGAVEKVKMNLEILLKSFPEKADGGSWVGYIAELSRGECSLGDEQKSRNEYLSIFQRGLNVISDAIVEEVKPNLAKITPKHSDAYLFVKDVIQVRFGEDEPPLDDIVSCMLNQQEYKNLLGSRAESLSQTQDYYAATSMVMGTFASAAAGFINQLLRARIAVANADRETEVDKANIAEYDKMLRNLQRSGGDSDGGEAIQAITPLLALFNVMLDPSQRLRSSLVRSHPDHAEKLSPRYLDLFKAFFRALENAEKKHVEEAEGKPLLTYVDCVIVRDARDANAAKPPLFAEMAINKVLKQIVGKDGYKTKKLKALAQVAKGCVQPSGGGPLTDEECKAALGIYTTHAENKMTQGIRLAAYVGEIGKNRKYTAAEKQVKDGCPSGEAPPPKFVYQELQGLCQKVLSYDEPSFSNSVRGAELGVGETLTAINKCIAIMPPVPQGEVNPFESLQKEAIIVRELTETLQETIFDIMTEASGPFLPHDSTGKVDRDAMKDMVKALPKPGQDDNSKRVRGVNGLQSKYRLADFLDDESLRHATREMCKAVFF